MVAVVLICIGLKYNTLRDNNKAVPIEAYFASNPATS